MTSERSHSSSSMNLVNQLLTSPGLETPGATFALPRPQVPGIDMGPLHASGTFGSVFLGKHKRLHARVAVKFIPSSNAREGSLDQALFEAKLMARLEHPNVLRIHDAGRAPEGLYIVTDFMPQGSLGKLRSAAPDLLEKAAKQLLSGLQAMHDARVLHRNIKPENCLVDQGRILLAEPGPSIDPARVELEGDWLLGSLPFLSPEVLGTRPAYSQRTDLFALGVTLLCLALDREPFPTQAGAAAVVAWVKHGLRPKLQKLRPELPANLVSLVDRLVSPHPGDRPASAAEALRWLENASSVASTGAEKGAPQHGHIGPWVLGEETDRDRFVALSATHLRTGAAARIVRLRSEPPEPSLDTLVTPSDAHAFALASAERASTFEHPGLLPVLDWGFDHEGPYLVTPARGRSLRSLVESGGPLDELTALELGTTLADALAWVHEQKLVFQLVEPSSVSFSADGRTWQLAWPVFVVPEPPENRPPKPSRARAGVPRHMPPELIESERPATQGSDLYGLGEVLFFALTGRDAFTGSRDDVLRAKRSAVPLVRSYSPDLTEPTSALISSLLSPNEGARPKSSAYVRDRIRQLAGRLRPRTG